MYEIVEILGVLFPSKFLPAGLLLMTSPNSIFRKLKSGERRESNCCCCRREKLSFADENPEIDFATHIIIITTTLGF